MMADRVDYLDYLSAVPATAFMFIMRAPPMSYVSNIFVLTFTGIAWICVISLVIACTIFIALTIKFQATPDKNLDGLVASDFFLFAIASVCQMSSQISTKIVSARILMVSTYISIELLLSQ